MLRDLVLIDFSVRDAASITVSFWMAVHPVARALQRHV
jgi:hypothetical protein